ncbi:MAG: GPW/gp25 family protein [Tannerella sp.]|jgi:phage baseplate assembly protein W|nr:GPW/gp25 family protein [Tannerella sp.]
MNCYKTPLLFSRLFESGDLSQCSEEDSIDRNLELIITTCPGEHKFDPGFGCDIWELDFENVVSVQRWESNFVNYISNAIRKYEPRIREIETTVHFFDVKNQHEFSGAISIRKRVDIRINAEILSSDKKCAFLYSLYLGPLTSD